MQLLDWLVAAAWYVLPFIVLLGVLVFVHELGHYAAAKLCGVAVDQFSVGFGKELWGRNDKSGTRWKISAIPLGGYCMFLGDADASSSSADGEKLEQLTEGQKKRAFAFQSPWKKLAIIFAGPAANYLFAVLAFWAVFAAFGKLDYPPVVGALIDGGAAQAADIRVGDRFLKINGREMRVFADIRREAELFTGDKIEVVLERGGKTMAKKFALKSVEVENAFGEKESKKLLGVHSVNAVEAGGQELSPGQALEAALDKTADTTMTTLRAVGQMLTGARSGEELGGIIRIAELTGDISRKNGLIDLVMFAALLSINLGLINFFPIPVLDGGQIVIYTLEMAVRRELPEKAKDLLMRLGWSLVAALMLFATWNDFARLFARWFS